MCINNRKENDRAALGLDGGMGAFNKHPDRKSIYPKTKGSNLMFC